MCEYVCAVCVWERERVCVWEGNRHERKREREREEEKKEIEMRGCVCVCVWERERERERDWVCEGKKRENCQNLGNVRKWAVLTF